ncbi:LysE family translocator [Amphritea balenae]|uniref:LysE family translocator n=1 Tax=Amphritea balenae TaxID=452629 RepID=A0A3P1SVZ6_9GAMM|nr:LysE family translocator [Amphritea balenae]RRD01382.1 LysE family translocator [Amphritea balenae]GGK57546.1 amino acid efflux permease RhtB family protein [Amphritea balenae]
MSEWLIFTGIMLMGAMVPGANTAIILRNTLQGSRRKGFITALGLATALAIHVLLSVIGLAALIEQTPGLYHAIRWLGSAYLIYMGLTYLAARTLDNNNDTEQNASGNPFIAGMMISLFNPKILIMFIAIFSHILADVTSLWMQILYYVTPVIVELSWLSLIIMILTQPGIQQTMLRIRTNLERIVGGGLVLLGVKLGLG